MTKKALTVLVHSYLAMTSDGYASGDILASASDIDEVLPDLPLGRRERSRGAHWGDDDSHPNDSPDGTLHLDLGIGTPTR